MEREAPPPEPAGAPPADAPRGATGILIAIGAAGVLLSLATFAVLCLRADERREAELLLRADAHALLLERFVEKHLLAVRSLQGLFQASEEVTPDEFRSFARILRGYAPAAVSLAYSPRVTKEGRGGVEEELLARSPSRRGIWELGPGEDPRPAGERDEWFPATLVDPLDAHGTALGFDLASLPSRRAAIDRARTKDDLTATEVVDLPRGADPPRKGIVIVAAVRKGEGAIDGVVTAVLPIEALVERALNPAQAAALDVSLVERTLDGDRPLHRHHAGADGAARPSVEHALSIADRDWVLVFRPAAGLGSQTAMPWIILLLGLLLTASGLTYTHALFHRQAAVSSLAEQRARELVAARERLEREQAGRRHAERLLLDAVDRINQGIALFGPDDRILFFNRNYPDSFQLTGSDLLGGARFEDIIREQLSHGMIEDAVGREEEWLQWRLEQHRRPSAPIEVRRHTGKIYRIVEHRLPNGGTFSVVTDITRERKAEEQLRQSQRMEGIGQLTGGVAHDFNNLLTVIMGNLDLVEDAVEDDSELAELARDANRAARRGAELTQRLLAFARRQPLLPASVDVNGLVERMSSLLQRTLGETIRLETVLAADVWPTLVDGPQLESALLNLAVNARDAMPSGGRLIIRTDNVLHEDSSEGPESRAPFVRIEVEDTGTGMTRDVLERAFEPFFTTKDVGKGSGLGLSMVYGFVRQSGGRVEIDSAVGRGTTVRLLLPRTEVGAAPPRGEPVIEEEPAGRGERIVVVEDDDELRDLVERNLIGLGYVVVAAANGKDALSVTNGEVPPDVLVTDVVLPEGLNGIELARRFRQRYPRLPILFISGYSDAQELRDSKLGRLLQKPFRREQLAREVRDLLDASG